MERGLSRCLATPHEPRLEPFPTQHPARIDQETTRQRSDSRERLAGPAARFTCMQPANPNACALRLSQVSVGFALHDLASLAVQHKSGSQVRSETVAAVHREGDGGSWVLREAKRGNLPFRFHCRGLPEELVQAIKTRRLDGLLASAARPAAASGPLLAHHRVENVGCPGVGEERPGRHDQEQRDGAPKPEDVVPVEVSRLGKEPAPEEDDGPEVLPGPSLRPPQVRARDDDEQKPKVAGSRNRLAYGSPVPNRFDDYWEDRAAA